MRRQSFQHGVHPKEEKSYTKSKSIELLPLPDDVFIPLQQHIGRACTPLVKKKDEVKTGQPIGEAGGFISSPVHSSVTGKVKDISLYMHYFGFRIPMVHIRRTGEDDWQHLAVPADWQNASAEELSRIIFEAGIVGMGGAAFPSHVKLSPLMEKPIDFFILNGCECEPYLTCDHRIMLEYTDKILTGMAIIMKMLAAKHGFIGIEKNKPDAIKRMRERIKTGGYTLKVVPLKMKYPQGAEKMLIKAILNRRVPTGGLPIDVGVIVHNVGTAYAVMEAVTEGKPLIKRIVSMTGDALQTPKNVKARIGTPLNDVIKYCGGLKKEITHIIMGGPMMGISQFDLSVPIVKASTGFVCTQSLKKARPISDPCIRCNSCVSSCPMSLLPNRLARYSEEGFYKETDQLGILNCIECGCCTYVCPSKIPVLQWIRVGKFKVSKIRKKAAG